MLYSFCSEGGNSCTDGSSPQAGLMRDKAGNLYGTTKYGGTGSGGGEGTIFKVDKKGHETVLYNFCSDPNCADGEYPVAGLIQDSEGNFSALQVRVVHIRLLVPYSNLPRAKLVPPRSL